MFRILAANTNEDALGLIRHTAETAGHAIETATTAGQFKAAFTRFRPDVVIVDLRMTDLGGAEIIRWLSEAEAPPRVILIAGGAGESFGDVAGEIAAVRGTTDIAMLPEPLRVLDLLGAMSRDGPDAE